MKGAARQSLQQDRRARRPEEMHEHTSSHSQGRRKGGCVEQLAIFATIGMSNRELVD